MHPTRAQALNSIRKNNDYGFSESSTTRISEIFAELVFTHKQMKAHLSGDLVGKFEKAVTAREPLDEEVASVLADAIMNWAVERGATHFTHWFQPLTGGTAEKHDSFISFDKDGNLIEKFSKSQLIQSEPDASSFPSGGVRSTFEARGYTAWDISSPVFLTEHAGSKILCIPSVFVSYTGHSLDTKTGLMRSIENLSKSACSFLAEMGQKVEKVNATVGVEQEYFLIDRNFVSARPDLLLCGRTLIGADMPKGQELEDHYFGAIPTRVQAFMGKVEHELYRLGVPVKTRHNEVAPSQFEMAPVFEDANLAADHNMLCMEVLKRTALKEGFACLMHEKPFSGINGSGKHNNWSIATEGGDNLLEPGKTPHENLRFLAVLSCVMKAVKDNQVALRAAIASHGNDHRLGANEAPPAIISVFLGDTLTRIMETIEKEGDLSKISAEQAMIDFGINTLPKLPKDNTDRNRTSPFAFTGNKFEFRAVGSSQAISYPMTMLNAAVATSMDTFTARLKELKATAASAESALLQTIKEFAQESSAIRFEGNGYSEEWRREAGSRGLKELLTTPDALGAFLQEENHQFLIDSKIYDREEFASVVNVQLERYSKHLNIEGHTTKTLVRQYVLPAAHSYQKTLADSMVAIKQAGGLDCSAQQSALGDITRAATTASSGAARLETLLNQAEEMEDLLAKAKFFASDVIPCMGQVREACDELEAKLPDDLWPLSKYRELLFVR